ncbi:transposase [Sporosarcina sp. SAFN-010]|uniref:transposase n=1 Tax=Sporosarcina sp. SAFN-010 TaxID=3387273 RepID=UPI003F7FB38E
MDSKILDFQVYPLLAEIGDIKRFDAHHALVKYAGLVWKQYPSGEFELGIPVECSRGDRCFLHFPVCRYRRIG